MSEVFWRTACFCAALTLGILTLPMQAGAAEGIDLTDQSNAFTTLLQSNQIETEMKEQQRRNTDVVNGVTPDMVTNTQNRLPRFNDFMGKIKYGTHNVVSKNGEQIVALIRSLAIHPEQSENILRQIQGLAKAKNPEALNFVGFVIANGLFGATINQDRANEYFRAAAASGYQPALYNLALDAAYNGRDHDALAQASDYIIRASNVALDSSSRVCGFASFLFYRQGDSNKATHFTLGCSSALNGLSLATTQPYPPADKRIALLRASIGAGVNDGYALLEQITRESATTDNQYLYCKYALLNRFRQQPQLSLNKAASQCYDKYTTDDKPNANRRNQVIGAITSFVYTEKTALEQMRAANNFRYSWRVPYLPFHQQDVDLFAPLFPRTAQ